jgi:hypothetical protein
MNSLREILKFIGQWGPERLYGKPGTKLNLDTSMATVGKIVPVLSQVERSSMRAMIPGLQNLPPFSLEVEAQDLAGEEPFKPQIYVKPSRGVILETRLAVFDKNGHRYLSSNYHLGASGGDAGFTQLGPGSYQFEIRRVGIPNTGITVLTKSFDVFVRAKDVPPPDPPTISKPAISVQSNGEGSFVVSGTNFLPNATVHIRVVDAALTNVWFHHTSTSQGTLQYPTGRICQLPGQLFFSANDGRKDQQDLTGTLWSNTVTTTCPG